MHVFGASSIAKVMFRPILGLGLIFAVGVFAPTQVGAQSNGYETLALSNATRAGLGRAGGGKVLSVERVQSGRGGLSRVKIMDPGGRIQIYVIEESPSLSPQSPFEREESGRVSGGRFFRGNPSDHPERGQAPRPRTRSGDVRERDN